MKSQVLHTVWCDISGEAAGEIWHWSLLGVKGLSLCYTVKLFSRNCITIQVSPKIASCNAVGFVKLFQEVSRNSFTKEHPTRAWAALRVSCNGATCFSCMSHDAIASWSLTKFHRVTWAYATRWNFFVKLVPGNFTMRLRRVTWQLEHVALLH